MEGFHLFQEKIKGEVNTIKSNDPQIVFLQSESLSGWDLSELGLTHGKESELKYLQPLDCDMEEGEYELAPFVNCSIEYSTLHQNLDVKIDDFRDVLSNFNNDLGMEGKRTIIMFYD